MYAEDLGCSETRSGVEGERHDNGESGDWKKVGIEDDQEDGSEHLSTYGCELGKNSVWGPRETGFVARPITYPLEIYRL